MANESQNAQCSSAQNAQPHRASWPTSFKDLKMQGWLTSLKMQNSIGKGQQMWQRWSESVGPEQKHMETCVVCQNRVAEVVRRHEGPSPKSFGLDENFEH